MVPREIAGRPQVGGKIGQAVLRINSLTVPSGYAVNCIITRNCRLAAIRSFFSFVAEHEPLAAKQCAEVLRVPFKRTIRRAMMLEGVEGIYSIAIRFCPARPAALRLEHQPTCSTASFMSGSWNNAMSLKVPSWRIGTRGVYSYASSRNGSKGR
jgi:hypothetical protein